MRHESIAKNERVNIRLNESAKQRIEQAAAFEGKTVSGFIVASALEHAEKTIQEHETLALSRRDADIFLDAILNPPQPNTKLLDALEEHGHRVVSR